MLMTTEKLQDFSNMKEIFNSHSTEETEQIARNFATKLDTGKPEFVAMFGDLGVGKTAFVRGVASLLASGARVKSPTFTVVNEYHGDKLPLYHFDVYRITDDDDLYSTGFYDYPGTGVCVCEWSENIPEAIPDGAYSVSIEYVDEEKRRITIKKRD